MKPERIDLVASCSHHDQARIYENDVMSFTPYGVELRDLVMGNRLYPWQQVRFIEWSEQPEEEA